MDFVCIVTQEAQVKGLEDHSSNDDYSNDNDEGFEDYKLGGYHPVSIGDRFNHRYIVLKKLGWGHFSTVWLCYDSKHDEHSPELVAVKIQKSAPHYRDAALDEIELLRTVSLNARSSAFLFENNSVPNPRVVLLLDHFDLSGPNGRHICMVFEVLGENLLHVIKRYNYRGIPLNVVKHFTFQILQGLDFLHRHCNMIHTDLKVRMPRYYSKMY